MSEPQARTADSPERPDLVHLPAAAERGDVTDVRDAIEALQRRHEQLRRLFAITAQVARPVEPQIGEVLALATAMLELDIGIVSHIVGQDYTIQHAYAPDTPVVAGQRFPLGETYCSITLQSQDILSIDHMQRTPHARHPCYKIFQLESYIGTAILVNGARYGTLNFSSATPRARPFSAPDREVVELVALWLGSALARRQSDFQRQEARRQLEETVAARTAALQEQITEREQVEAALRRQAEDLAVRNAELDAFAHTVAHDLKSPLGTLISYAQTLRQDPGIVTGEELADYLEIIEYSGRKAIDIVDALLLLGSVRNRDIHVTPLDMTAVIAEVRRGLTYLFDRHDVAVEQPAEWPVALGYAPWIEAVWSNYISNAIKYGGRPPALTLGADRLDDATIRFWVRDNGGGLTPEQQSRLFVPFTRLNKRGEGFGLGLSIVQRIVDKMGGQVGVASTPGQGSTFYFTLHAA